MARTNVLRQNCWSHSNFTLVGCCDTERQLDEEEVRQAAAFADRA